MPDAVVVAFEGGDAFVIACDGLLQPSAQQP